MTETKLKNIRLETITQSDVLCCGSLEEKKTEELPGVENGT